MARPRKDNNEPTAKERIQQAFWDNLEEHNLHSITVSMIVKSAGCNRGTFYYHYEDINSLINDVINEKVFINLALKRLSLILHSGPISQDIFQTIDMEDIKRISLLGRRGGGDLIGVALNNTIFGIWQAVFYGDELKPETRKIIDYLVGGISGLIRSIVRDIDEGKSLEEAFPSIEFVQRNILFVVENLANTQGVSTAEVKTRLLALIRYIKQNQLTDTNSI